MSEENNNITDFENFIYACNGILKVTDFDIQIVKPIWKETTTKESVFQMTEFVNTASHWEANKDKISTYAHTCKTKINHIVLVNQNNEILNELYSDLLELEEKLVNLNKEHQIGHVSKVHKNTWYIEFWDLIYSFIEWFEKRFKTRVKTNEAKGYNRIMETHANINFDNNIKKCKDAESIKIQLNQEWKYRLTLIGNEPDTIKWFEKYKSKFRPNTGDAYIDNILRHTMDQWFDEKNKIKNTTTLIDRLVWEGENNSEILTLFNLLMEDELIENTTKIENFTAIFNNFNRVEIIPIKWRASNTLLVYFLDILFEKIEWQSIVHNGKLFLNKRGKLLNKNDLAVAKSATLGKPLDHKRIDKIIKTIKKH